MSENQKYPAFLPGIQKPPHHSHEYISQQGRKSHTQPTPHPLTRQSSTHQWKFDVTESASSDGVTPRVETQAVPSISLESMKRPSDKHRDERQDSSQNTPAEQSFPEGDPTPSDLYQKSHRKEHKKRKSSRRRNQSERRKAKSEERISGRVNQGFQAEENTDKSHHRGTGSEQKGSRARVDGRENSVRIGPVHKKSSAGQAYSGVRNRAYRKSLASLNSQRSRSLAGNGGKRSALSPETKRNLNQNIIAMYISDNIEQRECSVYIKDNESNIDKCQCGREAQWHRDRGLDVTMETSNIVWNPSHHTLRRPCDSFGEVHFRGFGIQSNRTSPYLRVDSDCEMDSVWTVLRSCWQLPVPKLLISITGGAKDFHLRPRLKTILKQGLVNAAVTTGAWIITGGTATGVMEFVGEAVADHLHTSSSSEENQCVALGVASWGAIANNLALDGQGNPGLFPASYCMEDVKMKKNKAPLDHNHTHFLLVDDGSEEHFGVEIEFRSRLQSYISQKVETGVTESQSVNVPSVLIVVQGGINTMKTVRESITRNMPVVVIKGSGRAADFIATAFNLTKSVTDEDRSVYPVDFEETMIAKARVMFEWKQEMDVEAIDRKIYEALHYLEDCLEERKLINIFNLDKADSEKDIDRAILYALLGENQKRHCQQIERQLSAGSGPGLESL